MHLPNQSSLKIMLSSNLSENFKIEIQLFFFFKWWGGILILSLSFTLVIIREVGTVKHTHCVAFLKYGSNFGDEM